MSTLLSKLMKFVATAAAAAALLSAGPALAANYSLDDGLPVTAPAFPAFDLSKDVFVGPGAFTDRFFFDVTKAPAQSYSVTTPIYVSFTPTNVAPFFTMGAGTVSLFSQAGTLLGSQAFPALSGATFNTTLPSLDPLGSNVWTYFWVQVDGTATGSVGSVYNVTISAVPEPHEWAMLLAGLGMLGFVARRRRDMAA
ncbi:MAG: PEP-CTERM sorting domain-containing protein [Betaproteobacteria bacterium]|nr:PEP-CTERM sorting domain-containing protein [Betaproteobacteria bacterium]